MIDPRSLPCVRDPEIIPAVGELYRSREFPDRLVKVVGIVGARVQFSRSQKLPTHESTYEYFFNRFIHASAREDVDS